MDILLIIYSLLLFSVVLSPFWVLYRKTETINPMLQDVSELQSRRELLLENLKDMKAEMDTGKFTFPEFSESSHEIVLELKVIDSQLKDNPTEIVSASGSVCKNCNHAILLADAKFCYMCGAPL